MFAPGFPRFTTKRPAPLASASEPAVDLNLEDFRLSKVDRVPMENGWTPPAPA
jgi:hypothetical protein